MTVDPAPRGRPPRIKGKKIAVSVQLTEDEVSSLDALAATLRHTRSGYASYLLSQAIENAKPLRHGQEY